MRNAMRALRPAGPKLLALLVVILTLQALAVRRVSITEVEIPLPGLHGVPLQMGSWRASDELELSPGVTEYLKPDEYILRDYENKGLGSSINLFVAFFKSLQSTYGPHSPAVCLPGSGWLVKSGRAARIGVPGRPEGLPLNEYEMERSGERIFVMFWYQNNRDAWTDDFQAKLKMLPDLIRYRRSDASLVRLITSVHGLSTNQERANMVSFATTVYPVLMERFARTR